MHENVPNYKSTPKGKSVARALERLSRATSYDLAREVNKQTKDVISSLNTLYSQSKIHVGDYQLTLRGKLSKVWFWGDGDDVREPMLNKDKTRFVPRADIAVWWMHDQG